MQQSKKILCALLPILLLSCLLLVLSFFSRKMDDTQPSAIQVEIPHGTDRISLTPWQDSDGGYTIFLPSYCSLSDARFQVNTSADVTLDAVPLTDLQSLASLETGRTYTLKVNRRQIPLQIVQSANVSTLYLQTASGTMNAIHADKKYSEDVTVTLMTPQGALDHSGGDCIIRGRGNSTWVYEKRPYLLTFTQPTDLLDMGSANKWVLLANAIDESNLRNKLIYDLASKAGLPWVPECRYVDVYLNGEYAGLYLLAERVEIGETRLNIADDPNAFLCKIDLNERIALLEDPFITERGRTVEITAPENVSSAQKNTIVAGVQQMEDAIYQLQLEPMLDLDSWVIRFLIDEITENLDADQASSYFYYTDGKFYAGPVWDYDHIWATRDTNLNPEVLLSPLRQKAWNRVTPYNNVLYDNPVFYGRMTEIYETRLLPLFQQLADGGIEALAQEISAASTMNGIRWKHMYDYWNRPEMDAAGLTEFLTKRLAFLNSVWLEGEKYCTVQVEIGEYYHYLNYTVRPGETFDRLSEVVVPGVSDPVWTDSLTGEVFREDQPITRDTHLSLLGTTQTESRKYNILIAAYFGIIVAGTGVAVWVDRRGSRPKRRRKT